MQETAQCHIVEDLSIIMRLCSGLRMKKLNELCIEYKKEVLDLIDKSVSQQTIAEQCGVAKPTIGNINRSRNMTLKAWKENCSNKRKQKVCKTDSESANVLILKCFEKCHVTNIAVIRPEAKSAIIIDTEIGNYIYIR
jgi:hypothetical protein